MLLGAEWKESRVLLISHHNDIERSYFLIYFQTYIFTKQQTRNEEQEQNERCFIYKQYSHSPVQITLWITTLQMVNEWAKNENKNCVEAETFWFAAKI